MCQNIKTFPGLHLWIAGLFCIGLYVLGIYCRPVFPVDETRYLGVAWEMFSTRDFILPHLNLEAYDHKPPLLFWSINLIWSIFGVSQEAAMAVPLLFAFIFVYVSQRLARHLLPEDKKFPVLVTYILIGSLPFIIYSNMIMFDLILGVFAIIGITTIWDYAHTGNRKYLYIFALTIGLGAITKGPVILLHILFLLVFVKFWLNKSNKIISRKSWIGGFGLAIFAGIMMGLCWAIPAAIKGGPAFADKIFWGQTAGRVTNAFDHKQPFFWYFQFMPLLLAPWIFSPLFWRGLKRVKILQEKIVLRFLLIWVLPVFLSFCFISGKQIHYLIPLIPGFAIFTALLFRHVADTFKPRDMIIPFSLMGTLILAPFIFKAALDLPDLAIQHPLLLRITDGFDLIIPVIIFLVSALCAFLLSHKGMLSHVLAVSISSLLLMVCFQIQSRDGLFKNYDLRPMANVIMKNPNVPLAFTRNYHGEWSFMARLDRPVRQMDVEDVPMFFKYYPDGMVFVRTSHPKEIVPYDVIFSMPYKLNDTYYIIVRQGRADHYSK